MAYPAIKLDTENVSKQENNVIFGKFRSHAEECSRLGLELVKKSSRLAVVGTGVLISAPAFAEDTALTTGVGTIVTEIGTFPALIISVGVATLSVVLASRCIGWVKSAIK